VAVQRGQRLEQVMSPDELSLLRATSSPSAPPGPIREVRQRPELLVVLGGVVALVGGGIELIELSGIGLVLALVGACSYLSTHFRSRRLGRALDAGLEGPSERSALFFGLVDAFERAWSQEFALLVAGHDDGTDGTIELARGSSGIPVAEVTSWLLREADSGRDLILDDGGELGREGTSLALPLRRKNSALVGFLVLGGSTDPPLHVLAAARSRLDRIGLALAGAPEHEPRLAFGVGEVA